MVDAISRRVTPESSNCKASACAASTTRAISLAVETRELRADTDARQFAFEIFGIALALHQDTRLFDPKQARTQAERAFQRLIAAYSR